MQAANSKLKNIIRSTAHTLCHNLSPPHPLSTYGIQQHGEQQQQPLAPLCSVVHGLHCPGLVRLGGVTGPHWMGVSAFVASRFFLSRTPKLNRTPKSKQRSNLTLHNGSQTVSNCSRQRFQLLPLPLLIPVDTYASKSFVWLCPAGRTSCFIYETHSG